MSEETVDTVESTDNGGFQGLPDAVQETVTEQQAPQRPAGYDPIDFKTATPEEIEARFHHVYKQVKDTKRLERDMREFKKIADEQSRYIEELTTGFSGMASHLQERTFAETEASLNTQMRTALESGDTAQFVEIQNKLIDIRAEKKLQEQQQKQAPVPRQAPQQQPVPQLEPEDQRVVNSWQEERDATGMPLRPWAKNRGTETDPDPMFMHALFETQAVMSNPAYANMDYAQKLAEVDRRMGVKKTGGSQTVMGGNLTGASKPSKLSLSPEQERIAVRMKVGGSKAKSNADHIAAYRAQLEQKKGTR